MHRILSCPAAEKLLIAVRGVSYPHIAQLKGCKMNRTDELLSLELQQNNLISSSCLSV